MRAKRENPTNNDSAADATAFTLSNIRFKDVLDIESLQIDACEVSAIVHPSGGGKTTLLRILIAGSMLLGTTAALAYFLFVIVSVSPRFDSLYFIPVAGK